MRGAKRHVTPITMDETHAATGKKKFSTVIKRRCTAREVHYQTKKSVFDHISKHQEKSSKYNVRHSIFDQQGSIKVFGNVIKHSHGCLWCLIYPSKFQNIEGLGKTELCFPWGYSLNAY